MTIFVHPQKETPGIAAALGRDNKDYELDRWEAAGWYAGFVVVSALSMLLLAKAAKTIPIGTAYPVWTGIGAIGTVLIGILVFKEPASFWRLFFIFTLIASVIGLRMV